VAVELSEDSVIPAVGVSGGTISVGERCVTYEVPGGNMQTTLIWFEGMAHMDSDGSAVLFSRTDGAVVSLEDGARVDFFGLPVDVLEEMIVAPYEDCPEDRFLVYEPVRVP